MYRRNEAGIYDRPFFHASARVVAADDASDDGTLYGASPDIFRVYSTEYTRNLNEIISKCFSLSLSLFCCFVDLNVDIFSTET